MPGVVAEAQGQAVNYVQIWLYDNAWHRAAALSLIEAFGWGPRRQKPEKACEKCGRSWGIAISHNCPGT